MSKNCWEISAKIENTRRYCSIFSDLFPNINADEEDRLIEHIARQFDNIGIFPIGVECV